MPLINFLWNAAWLWKSSRSTCQRWCEGGAGDRVTGTLTNRPSPGKLEAVQGPLYVPCGPYLAKLHKSPGFHFYELPHPTFLLKAPKNPRRGSVSHSQAAFGHPPSSFLSNLTSPQADRQQSIGEFTEISACLLKCQSLFWSRCLVFSKTHLITRLPGF